jgi:hypothetical protein
MNEADRALLIFNERLQEAILRAPTIEFGELQKLHMTLRLSIYYDDFICKISAIETVIVSRAFIALRFANRTTSRHNYLISEGKMKYGDIAEWANNTSKCQSESLTRGGCNTLPAQKASESPRTFNEIMECWKRPFRKYSKGIETIIQDTFQPKDLVEVELDFQFIRRIRGGSWNWVPTTSTSDLVETGGCQILVPVLVVDMITDLRLTNPFTQSKDYCCVGDVYERVQKFRSRLDASDIDPGFGGMALYFKRWNETPQIPPRWIYQRQGDLSTKYVTYNVLETDNYTDLEAEMNKIFARRSSATNGTR